MEQTDILKRLLGSGRQRRQMIGALIGALIGFLMLLGALQLYLDYKKLFSADAGQYVQVNKKVSVFNTLGVAARFSEAEIKALEEQDFTRDLGKFVSNDFRVKASSPRLGFSTEMFFEAVPDQFLDVDPREFQWENGQRELPIILSRDYLALYNFGFAPSQGLPQFTPNTIRKATFQIQIAGPGGSAFFNGRIVGFSDRINSILVPLSFMEWANGRYGLQETAEKAVSRLILQVDNPMDQGFQEYLAENQLELSSGRLIGGEFATLASLISGLFILIGLLILFLSALIFALNFRLLVVQSSEDIRLLFQLGYRKKQILEVFYRYQILMLGGILVAALALLSVGHMIFAAWVEGQGFALNSLPGWQVFVVAFSLTGLAIWLNRVALEKQLGALQE